MESNIICTIAFVNMHAATITIAGNVKTTLNK